MAGTMFEQLVIRHHSKHLFIKYAHAEARPKNIKEIASKPKLAPTSCKVNSFSVLTIELISAPIIATPKTLNSTRPTSIAKNTIGF